MSTEIPPELLRRLQILQDLRPDREYEISLNEFSNDEEYFIVDDSGFSGALDYSDAIDYLESIVVAKLLHAYDHGYRLKAAF